MFRSRVNSPFREAHTFSALLNRTSVSYTSRMSWFPNPALATTRRSHRHLDAAAQGNDRIVFQSEKVGEANSAELSVLCLV